MFIQLPIPPYFQKHLDDKMLERKMPDNDIKIIRKWLAGGPSVPVGSWCGSLASGWKVVGKDHLPNSVLEPYMSCHKDNATFNIP